MRLFLDIETIPASQKDHEYLKQDFLKKPREIEFEEYVKETALDGNFGRILCIGYALDEQPPEILEGSEADLLKRFWAIALPAHLFIGHNIFDFDLRFILKRSVINQVKPSRELSFARYRNIPIFDTMHEWERWAYYRTSLKTLGHVLEISVAKGPFDGSQVPDLFSQGRAKEIYDYCKRDVELTRAIYNRMTFQGS